MIKNILIILGSFILLLSACASPSAKPPEVIAPSAGRAGPLGPWVAQQSEISWRHLQENISPQEPKTPGGPKPLPGIVVAALSKKDPDYYFHWVRDSANVMSAVVAVLSTPPARDFAKLDQLMGDFLHLSSRLQKVHSAHGLGEPRYTVDGQADTIPWSRPQFDGPALRALAIMRYLDKTKPNASLKRLALEVLKTDLDFIARVWSDRGFDIWEEYRADNYNTRLVQMVALEKGKKWVGDRHAATVQSLTKLLDDHWDPARGFLRSQLAIAATDGYTTKKTDLDSAVLVTVLDADREGGIAHTVLDDRVQATVGVLEELFRSAYPINQAPNEEVGLAYGRYSGDTYYGGNPWYLITAYYARFYYRLAEKLQTRPFVISKINLKFALGLLPKNISLQAGQTLAVDDSLHKAIVAACRERGDSILRRLRLHTPADGQLYEQIDKVTGKPVSSRGIGWAHASYLETAADFSRLAATPRP